MTENIQDIPQSITVISKEDIEQKGIKNASDIIKELPNMDNETGVYGNISIRGLNTSIFTSNNPIVFYIDGVPYYSQYDLNVSLANAQQIEVLRGPQGTLYGKDAIGGVINIVTKPPQNKWGGEVGVEYGNNNTFDTIFNTSGAIIDNKLFAGINNSYYHSDGWITNHHNNMDKNANKKNNRRTSTFLLYKPTYELSARLTLTNNFDKTYWMNGYATNNTSKPIKDFKRKDAKNADFDVATIGQLKINSQALNLSYEMEKLKLESVTTHKKNDIYFVSDVDNTSGNSADGLSRSHISDMYTWTQELRLSSKNQNIKWITGLYFDKDDIKKGPYGNQDTYMGDLYGSNSNSDTSSKSQAIFGQIVIPFLKDYELTLGGRYQKIKKDITADVLLTTNGIPTADFLYKDKKTFNVFLPKVAVSYKANDNLTTYVSVSKGYMPGGFNFFPSSNISSENSFESQKSTNYEIGTKYIGQNFALNTSIFRMDIKDIHIYKVVGMNFVTGNANKAHSQGIEIDGTYFLSDNLSIYAALGLIKAKYDDYDDGIRKYDNERMVNTPQYTANLGIQYLNDNGVYGRFDLNGIGKTSFQDTINDTIVEADGGITADINIGYKLKKLDIYGFVKNITNEDYIKSIIYETSMVIATFNEPRKFGLGIRYKF